MGKVKTRGQVLWEGLAAARPMEALRRWWSLRGRRSWVPVVVTLAVLAGMAVWAIWVTPTQTDAAWLRIRQTGVITFVTDAGYPPFSALDADGGFSGFDVDVAREIGRRLNLRVDFENVAYDGLLGTLVVGRDDAAISALVAQPSRLHEVAYTRPYFNAGSVLVVHAGEPLPAQPMRWSEHKVLAVEYGSQAEALAHGWAQRVSGLAVLSKPDPESAMSAVEQRAAAGALVDAVTAYVFLQAGRPDLAVTSPVDDVPYVIAVARRSANLQHALESTLEGMRADGTLGELRVRWFGEAARKNDQ